VTALPADTISDVPKAPSSEEKKEVSPKTPLEAPQWVDVDESRKKSQGSL
jgi:hypothetical protein